MILPLPLGLALLLRATPTAPADLGDAAAEPASGPARARPSTTAFGAGATMAARRERAGRRRTEPSSGPAEPPERRFKLGLEGVVIQAPPLRPEVVRFDSRFVGRSISMGGLGLFGRFDLHPRISVEATVRSGSVRYASRSTEDDDVVSQDQVMADLGVLLFVARGEMARLGFDAGLGGMGTRVQYEIEREGTQLFGSGLVRVGADAEFLVNRIAFVVSVRACGVFTRLDRVRNRGPLVENKDLQAPVPALQTMLVGSAGVAYRF